MKDYGVFDIIGPCMIGPSSSHTAGAARLGYVAYQLSHGRAKRAHVTLYGSFAETGRGHGTDKAIIGGILGFLPSDPRLRTSLQLVQEQGLDYTVSFSKQEMSHPNTAKIEIETDEGQRYEIVGVSVGGGNIEIQNVNGMDVSFSNDYPTLLIFHQDRPGVMSSVSKCLSDHQINIAFMRVFRTSKRQNACMVIETDEPIEADLIHEIKSISQTISGVVAL